MSDGMEGEVCGVAVGYRQTGPVASASKRDKAADMSSCMG